MNELWIVPIAVAAVAAIGMLVIRQRKAAPPVLKFDSREVRLSHQLSRTLGCSAETVLPSVQQEIDLASHLSDETILKRAKYHYQQNLPEAPCGGYRDRAVG